MYVRADSVRLHHVRQHQSDFHVGLHKGQHDFTIQLAHINDLAAEELLCCNDELF